MPWISPVDGRAWVAVAAAPWREGALAAAFRVLAGAGAAALLADFLVTVALLAFLGVACLPALALAAGAGAFAVLPRPGAALAAVFLAGSFLVVAAARLAGALATVVLAFLAAGRDAGAFLTAAVFFTVAAFLAAGLAVAALPAAGFRALDVLAPAAVLPAFFLLDRDAAAITLAP